MVAKTKFVLQKEARAVTSDGSVTHDGFSVREDVGLIHEVSCQENYLPLAPPLQDRPQVTSAVGVNTWPGLT